MAENKKDKVSGFNERKNEVNKEDNKQETSKKYTELLEEKFEEKYEIEEQNHGDAEEVADEGVIAEGAEDLALDDERRIKVISPGMLVLRRFIRNRLAIVGMVILIVMSLFSFLGGVLSPYGQSQTFKRHEDRLKIFGGASRNKDFRYVTAEDFDFPYLAQARFIQAKNRNQEQFSSHNVDYAQKQLFEDCYLIYASEKHATAEVVGKFADIRPEEGVDLPEGFVEAAEQAIKDRVDGFVCADLEYKLIKQDKGQNRDIVVQVAKALADKKILSMADEKNESMSFDLQYNTEIAISEGKNSFELNGENFELSTKGDDLIEIKKAGEVFATLGYYAVQPVNTTIFLPLEFKATAMKAINEGQSGFTADRNDGEGPQEYKIRKSGEKYEIMSHERTYIYDEFAPPSKAHWLGTDKNGMDAVTRLMYGGRISLMVGFVVVFIELFIGVTLGGISGFFGGWVDMLIMRIVDIMYCIPTWPILIILGAVMDAQRASPDQRMLMIMIVLGLLGWAGITRMVRGQILSLREQEFMIAAEATGLSTKRRIFRHLVPNVMPQLIVIATLGLGGTILTESTLSFLGIGVKYPYASWGNIVNSVSDQYVMMNYPQAWIPAGFCILITVLAFNFVGDGLRDAFDPKMKR